MFMCRLKFLSVTQNGPLKNLYVVGLDDANSSDS